MKIVCQNCSAKYSIADDKVQGKKVFKIKCKKCGEDILVRGSEGADADASGSQPAQDPFNEEEATRVVSSGDTGAAGAEGWHVLINGDQQGPFSVPQLKDMLASKQIDGEAFVWNANLTEWKALKDVPELATLLPKSEADTAKARAGSKASSGGDMFGGATVAAEDEVSTSASSGGGASSASKTGSRNENSVLFSLASLQQIAGAEPGKPASGGKSADASGIIDIKSMGSSLSGGVSKPKSAVDDLLSVGSSSAMSSPLAAPMLAPVPTPSAPAEPVAAAPAPAPRSNAGMFALVAVAVILVAGGLGIAYMLKKPPQTVVINQVQQSPGSASGGGSSSSGGGSSTGGGSTGGETGDSTGGMTISPGANTTGRVRTTTTGPAGTTTAPAATAGGTTGAAPATTGSTATSSSSTSGNACMDRCHGDVTCMMRCTSTARTTTTTTGTTGTTAPATSTTGSTTTSTTTSSSSTGGGSNLPDQPSRADVQGAMNRVRPAVAACAGGQTGAVTANVTFAGSNGRVTSASISGAPFQGSPAGSCMARALRNASVPPFARPSISVSFPYRI